MNSVCCLCCGTVMKKVRKRQIFRHELESPPSYECPQCYATAVCDKDSQLSFYDVNGKQVHPSHDK